MSSCLSPRIAQLRQDLSDKHIPLVIEAFWAEIERTSSPLVETGENAQEDLVTFLWRNQQEGQEVVVYGEFPGFDRVNNRLEHIPGTDVYYKTFIAPTSVWSLYIYRLPAGDGTDNPLYVIDPLNPRTYTSPLDDDGHCPLLAPIESVVVLPGVKGEPWNALPSGALERVEKHTFYSGTLKNERRVWVYTPPSYNPQGEPCDVLVITDGWEYMHMAQLPQKLDLGTSSGQVVPLVVVMIDSLCFRQREKELTCFPPFGEFIVDELLPWVADKYNVSSLPQGRYIAGASYGGLAAVWLGMQYPELFTNIIAQSGAFYWNDSCLISSIQAGGYLPLNVWIEVGLLEPEQLVSASKCMHSALEGKVESVEYRLTNGGHHYIYWGDTLISALSALTTGTAI